MGRFIKDAQVYIAAFHDSLKKENKQKFYWTDVQTEAFNQLLDRVAKITELYHYSPKRQTRLKCDASKQGLGACLEQELEDGSWVPIAFAS